MHSELLHIFLTNILFDSVLLLILLFYYAISILYLTGVNPEDNSIHKEKPCPLCARTIIQAGINNVYLRVGEGAGNYIVVPATELEWVQSAD